MPDNPPIIAGTRIGHVHLKVADLDRALAFYCGVLGFQVTQRLSSGAAFIAAGSYHHHIGLNTWESKGGHPPPPGTTGLFHTAILYPTRAALADALHRLIEAGIALDGASDHGVSEALYLRDPDENGVELYRDRPEAEWPRQPDDVHQAARSGGAVAAAEYLVPHGEGLRASRTIWHNFLVHPSRRGRAAAPQDEVRWFRPRIMISTAATSCRPMQP
jgi:catechol 2,3-dioxygenase